MTSYSSMLLAQQGGGAGGMVFMLVFFAIVGAALAGMWKVFSKAGQPGWAIFVPIYNLVCLAKIAGRPAWWAALCFIPWLGLIPVAMLTWGVAKNFGKGAGFAVGLILAGPIFYPILGFGGAQYNPNGDNGPCDSNVGASPIPSAAPGNDQHQEAA